MREIKFRATRVKTMKMIDNWLARPIEEVKTPCFYCGGRGKVYEMNAYDEEAWVTCSDCEGDGYILKEV